VKLEQLIKLADAALDEPNHGRLHYFITEFYNAANPATIKRMAELLVQCREALLWQHGGDMRKAALAALDEFDKEQ
jgi:hypothetical protein